MVSLISWALSDIGRKRPHNEDSFFHNKDYGLFMVADGMGGHQAGGTASKLAIDTAALFFKQNIESKIKLKTALEKALAEAALKVYEEGKANLELRGMGTTLSAMAIDGNKAVISHIGDSRIYRIRNKNISLLTCDHSLVNEQVRAGVLLPEDARNSSLRNIITRAIGHTASVQADHLSFSVEIGDIFLLCTDGLNGMIIDERILEIINNLKPELAIQKLIDESNQKGGDDNITAILVQINF